MEQTFSYITGRNTLVLFSTKNETHHSLLLQKKAKESPEKKIKRRKTNSSSCGYSLERWTNVGCVSYSFRSPNEQTTQLTNKWYPQFLFSSLCIHLFIFSGWSRLAGLGTNLRLRWWFGNIIQSMSASNLCQPLEHWRIVL